MNKKILILGGDLRQLSVANEFKIEGYEVSFFAFENCELPIPYYIYNDIDSAFLENNIIILGMPVSRDGIHLNTPFSKLTVKLSDISDRIKPDKKIFGGILPDIYSGKGFKKNSIFYDYGKKEELTIKNVVPTVEGAIALAIENTPFTIHSSNILICGFGRIGKILAKDIASLGANVTVSARKPEDLAWIDCYGYNKIKTNRIYESVNTFDIIFNTIPSTVIDEECLKRVKKNALIIDLASGSGGVDLKYAKLLDINVIRALSIPGKVAPKTSGKIIKDTIVDILKGK